MTPDLRFLNLPGRWTVHSYYTLCPWAPDGSGRLLAAGAELESNVGDVFILSAEGEVLDQFGSIPVTPSFWHTGFWQSWSQDCKYVYYQAGTLKAPKVCRRELATGQEVFLDGDLEGMPISGEPGISCNHGMLYAAGYGDGKFKPEQSSYPFQDRDAHGLFTVTFDPPQERLVASVNDILARHPERGKLLTADQAVKARLGQDEGLTLMTYCVRWNPAGDRFLFYFGNHCVDRDRKEPKIAYVFTAKRDLSEMHLAVDFSFDKRGVHWGWHCDGEHLIGYGPKPDGGGMRLTQVKFDGSDYRELSKHASGGHPTVCPSDPRLIVTDESSIPGRIVFIDIENDAEVTALSPGRVAGDKEPAGRNPYRVCHHPVFSPDGNTVLCNTLNGQHAQLALIDVEPILERLQKGEHL